ncbi:MAG: Polyketide synthase modules and related proteins, partial [uncultured Gemmatimonadetes bacterium]
RALAEVWAEVLGVERVGRWDHFFEMGGHSLLAVRVVSRIRQALGVEVTLGDLFARPVLADFARALPAAGGAALPAIEPADRGQPLPLSFAQQRLWFLEQMGAAGRAYHIPAGLRLRGELDAEALARALDRIVERHEALRTVFPQVDGEPVQRIAPTGESGFLLVQHDLRAHPDAEAELRRILSEESAAPFDLRDGPLVRGRLIRLAEDDHVLVVTMHHIVSDGWSMGVLTRELSTLYAAFHRGDADPLPPLPIQYADYAVWQRRWVEGEVLREQAEYWKTTLAGAPDLLELPADRPRPALQDHAGDTVALELDAELTAALRALSQRHGTTLFMTLLAGWAAVLARLSAQDEVVIGTPTANRGRGEIEGLIGFFVNTLALRMDLSGAPTVAELLERVKARTLEAQRHQDIPFEQVVELARPARSLAHTPLFQVLFTWQNEPVGAMELPGLTVGSARGDASGVAKFDLSLSLGESGGRITGGVSYATALYERATVERYAGYLRRALREMAAGDGRQVGRLELLSGAERAQVVEGWNATDAEFPREACIHELFEAQAERTPGAPALVSEGEALTYAELNGRANQLAHHLRELGVGPDARVAVSLERGTEMVVALLAVLKAGGAYVPLDPSYPADRLRYMLDDSAPMVLLTQAALAGGFADAALPTLALDGPDAAWAGQPRTNPARAGLTPGHLAYVIYTSGSTGRPKGVMCHHQGAVNRLVWMQEAFGLDAHEAVLQKTSFSFDVSVWEFFWPLMVGARLVMARPGGHKDPEYLVETVRREGITTLHFVPSMLQLFLEHPRAESCQGLKRVVCSGEALPVSLARQFHARLPQVELHNLYGPTEAAVDVTWWRSTPGETRGRIPIGAPISNTRLYVLDGAGEPVPAGVAGELHIGGVQVARGYLGRAELTADRFVPDPFSAEPGARLYRTGDLARWLADGTIDYLGRNDHQVKVRGFRIELGEIEARLAEHPAVREAVVLARQDGPGDTRLVAYVVGEAGETEALRAHLAERVPDYMAPAAYVWLRALPLSPNGKVDRKALPAPEGDAFAARGYEAPLGDAERALAEVWAELLGVERVGRWDHFFALGGHSLLAVRVVSRVRQALGVEVTLGDLFARPVLADFARALPSAGGAPLPAIEPADRGQPLPLSFAQQRLWFLEQMGAGGRAYHIPAGLRLRGELDAEALARALDRIVERHEALRTVFPQVDGEPVQRIALAGESGFLLVHHDLRAHPDAEAELRRITSEEYAAPFDLQAGPLVRGRLIRLGDDDHVLAVTMHHIVSDGWSAGVLTRELSALYAAFHRGEADPLPALPIQYADYAVWQRRWVEGEVLREQAEYWKTTFAGAPELLELPADRARPALRSHAGDSVALELDAELTAALRALAQRHGTTLFMTLLAGWSAVLARLSGQDEVVIGTPTANRGQAEIEGLIGFFVNTLALRMDLSGAPTVAELLERVRARALEAQQHQDIPFEQVVELAQPARSLAHTPLFQVLFTWQNVPRGALELPGLVAGSVGPAAHTTAKFDLSLAMQETGGRIVGNLTYATALFDRATVERWVGYLRRVLEEMAAGADRRVERLALQRADERRRVVEEWNRTEAEYPSDACVHELFEAQAARTPGAAAVVWEGGESLTYAGLNGRANRLAHHLRARGVGPDVPVGLCLERGPELVVALLAVLKAGGAYVPLDPEYPEDRLSYMLADSAPAVLLAQASLAGLFAGADVPRIRVDADAAEWAGEPETDPARGALTPEHLAYVIYTSGSTGRPKGVMNPHRTLVNRLAWGRRSWEVDAGESMLLKTSLSFDGSIREIFLPLMAGARVVLARPGGQRDPSYLLEVIGRENITTVNLVPSLLQLLLEAPEVEGLRGLKRVLCGGEALPGALLERFRERLPGVELHNLYGPSEAATAVTSPRCQAEPGRAGVPIGGPSANSRAYVLNGAGEPVPLGVAGELYIGGVSVARGYLGRAAMTAERFVPDPFAAEPGARLYRTGDVVRWLDDGRLDFVGRNDDQVKVRGFRVEPDEVAARLREHPGVREAAVAVREDVPGDRRLVAYCVADGALDVETLRAHLAGRLPEYMVPAAYVRLDALPLTASGKLDRRALPAPGGDAYAVRGYERPAGAVEEALAEIWAEVLGVERVGRHDHFFDLGGHSLLVVRVISRVRQALGVEVAPLELFRRQVLADFAEAVEAASRPALPPLARVGRDGPLVLSFAQQRLWFLEQMGGLGATYHIPAGLRLTGELDRAALGRALDRIVERHEALRTTFARVGGEPVQRVAPAEASRFALEDHDLRGNPGAGAELRALAARVAAAPFDLERGPLIRGALARLDDDEHLFLVAMHHIVSDGWSMGVLTQELSTLYAAFRRGDGDPLPPLPVQFADYAAWQRAWVSGDVLRAQADYWAATLAGAPEQLQLPTDRPRPTQQSYAGGHVALELNEELTAGLRALGQRHGATLFMTLLAGWAAVLARLSGQDDVVVGTPTANRGQAEVEGLIGFFVNTLALRVDLSGAPTVAELLGRVKARALDAQHHQDIPFEQVVERVQPARSLARTPLFQAMFMWQNTPQGRLELPGLQVGAAGPASPATAKFDLTLTLAEAGGRIAGALTYATALFDAATVERFGGYLRAALEGMVAAERLPVDRLPLLSAAERVQVVEEWNATDAEYPRGACLHELFEAQARQTPQAAAVAYEDRSLTYAALDARADGLARHLRGLGVGPGSRVALCVERGPEMVAGLLGVLKAGAAYVPLDPTHPDDRLRYVLRDSAPAVLLTQSSLAERFGDAGVPLVDLLAPAWEDGPAAEPVRPASADPAYVIYTSGSTGMPKGVIVEHRQVVNFLWSMRGLVGVTPRDRLLAVTTLAFDIAGLEIFLPLVCGARVAILDRASASDPARLAEAISAHGATVLQATPATWRMLVDSGWAGAPGLRALCGGEAMPAPLAAALRERVGALWNVYGPTETTIWSSAQRVDDGVAAGAHVPIGGPIANTRLYLLDGTGEPVPAGVVGELYIGGEGVARGYLGRPGLTAERFVADPFSARPGARMYRTGDLARRLPNGAVEFLGRTDFQVKIRGFRIEPGEIEARLAEHPRVRQAVVLAREDAPGDRRLAAYYVAEEALDAEALRAHLGATLPEHMVPAAYVWLRALPLTPNGKLDRGALPAPEGGAFATRAYEPPLGETERALAEIWAELLGVERVGRHDHFFALGGHSLLAVVLMERLRRRGMRADMRALFSTPTLAELAASVGAEPLAVEVPPSLVPAGCGAITPEMLPLVELTEAEIGRIVAGVPGGAANVQDVYPLAPLQEGIFFHHLVASEGDPYLLSMLFSFDGRERLDAFVPALRAVIARHDVLRTSLAWEGLAAPVQVVWRDAPFALEEVDAGGADAARFLRERFHPRHHPMDLRRAPLLRGYAAHDEASGRWVLLLRMHHLAGDHATLELLRDEVQAHILGQEDRLPAPRPYREFVAQARLGAASDEHERFFRRLLGGVDEPTTPFGLLDVRGGGSGMGEARLGVDAALAGRLRARARALGVSAASLFHVAFAQVLARASGRGDVVFGTVLFGRMQGGAGSDRAVGLFINTLPVRIGVGAAGAEAAVRDAHALLADLLRHEHASLALAQRGSGVAPSVPLFSALLNYRHGRRADGAGEPRGAVHSIPLEGRTSYPLSLSVDDLGDGFRLTAQLPESVGPARVCQMMHAALEGLAGALETAPGTPLGLLDVLPADERRRVLHEWNATEAEYPRDSFVHELFEAQVERTPGAAALVSADETLTYAELNGRANQLAHHLRGLGVGPGARVALCLEHGAGMVAALLAVLKAGGAYVPLDPSHPADRLREMLQDSAPRVLLTQAALAGAFTDAALPALELDGPAAPWAREPRSNCGDVGVRPEGAAYVIYTSGSTGRPKGVVVPHQGLTHYATWARARYAPEGPLAFALYSSLAFDLTVTSIYVPLISGGSVVVYGRAESGDTPILRVWADDRVDVVKLTPAHLVLLAQAGPAPRRIRRLVVGGEELKAPLARATVEASAGRLEIHNEYGPTEATVGCMVHRFDPERDRGAAVPIGVPIDNTRVYVLDARGEPAPVGVAGELYVGGAQVALGYLGRAGLTAERFVPDAFSGEPGARMYRTGDLARWGAQGTMEYLGRNDFQVKIRGYRVELGEIEARLAEHPEVGEAVVLAHDSRLVGYYVAGEAVGAEALRAHLAEHLPEYMVPAAYVRLDALPLTPNGKLDRKALPAAEGDAFAAREYEAPLAGTERALAEIWAEVLGVERVGRWDHFFDLGGHSLLAVRVISRVRQALGVEVALADLFARPVLADFAGALPATPGSRLPAIEPADRGEPLPLSFAQQRLWFIDQMGSLGSAYHIPVRLRLRGELDRVALGRALDRVVERHEALRTAFPQVDGEPVQRVAPVEESRFLLLDHDLRAHPDAEAELRRLGAEEARTPFDLERGPLIRGGLVRLGDDDHVLMLTLHHIVSDGWSMGVLVDEVSALYGAFLRGDADPLPPLPIQYADYAVWQRRWVEGEVLREQAEYWKATLAGAPELLELPADRPRPAVQDTRGAYAGLELDAELTAGLKALGQRHGTTLFMTLLAGWAAVLARLSGQEDVVIGTPTANRGQAEIEGLIGFFVNTLALRMDLSGMPTVAELLERVKGRALEAQRHQDIPFEQVVELARPARSMAHTPLFQVMFTWQNTSGGTLELPGLVPAPVGSAAHVTAKFDLSLSLQETGGRITGGVEYTTALFDAATVERFLGYFRALLAGMVADERVAVERLPMLPADERRRVLHEWNATEAEYPDESCIHELFEAQVQRAPDAAAVVHQSGTLTYAELNGRANRLAHHLRTLGVEPDARVAIHAERGPEMVVALLAVLKAGGAYVPLDPSYPEDRLRYMLADS